MSHVLGRHCHTKLPTVVAGDGAYLIDKRGKRYLDASGGAAVSCLGHSYTPVIAATQAQLGRIAYAHTSFFTSEVAENLAAKLCKYSPGQHLQYCYFVSGGSEAVEAALKLARQYHLERGDSARCHIISRRQSYHGNTLGALAAGGNAWRRQPFLPLLGASFSHIAPCYRYRDQQPGETDYDYGQRVANALEQEILRIGADKVSAFIAEPVVGATLGAVPAVAGYFTRIREICSRYGVLLILDEVMCGMGRTGYLYAHQHEQTLPDIVCIAKGLGAGIQPIGATLCTREIFDAIAGGSGFFQHGHTYLAHPTACATALAVLNALLEDGLITHCAERGRSLMAQLQNALGDHPHVGDIRGRGLFIGLELVAERESKRPFEPGLRIAAQFKQQAMRNGLMTYPMSGTVDGKYGDHILLAPPYIIEQAEIDHIVQILHDSLNTTLDAVLRA